MNSKSCSHCASRNIVLLPSYFRRWSKPLDCKHIQCTSSSKWEYEDTNNTLKTRKLKKFWRSKVLCNSLESMKRYFTNLNDGSSVGRQEISHREEQKTFPKPNKHCNSCDNDVVCDTTSTEYNCSGAKKAHKHFSAESCAVYCQLSKHGWYWGGITAREAEELLSGQQDNVFLVRDSYNSRHLLCVSFRCVGKTLHARLRHANGLFSLNDESFVAANNISEHCTSVSVTPNKMRPSFTVKLAMPLNRFSHLNSLQKMSRLVIRQTLSSDCIRSLPLPSQLIDFILNGSDYIVPEFSPNT